MDLDNSRITFDWGDASADGSSESGMETSPAAGTVRVAVGAPSFAEFAVPPSPLYMQNPEKYRVTHWYIPSISIIEIYQMSGLQIEKPGGMPGFS